MKLRRLILIASLFLLPPAGLIAAPAPANTVDFPTWLAGLRQDALAQGIRAATLDRALAGVRPIPRVIELDNRQPEKALGLDEYLQRAVTPGRIAAARQRLAENRPLLNEVGKRYGVQPGFIVALWGMESDFGRSTGGFPVVGALATLAYDGRRSAFFRSELIAALKILDHGDIAPEAMTGSWAGAMGQSQFMPSSFLSYAVDWRGDGKRDIWSNREDVFASIANYLSRVGWHPNEAWGRAVRLPTKFDGSLIGIETRKSMGDWQRLGVRQSDGGDLRPREVQASLIQPAGSERGAFLVTDNFKTIMKWNHSFNFAIAVGSLADAMEDR